MSDESRALLDELFGRDRNLPKEQRRRDDHYWDEQVCKNSLVSICFNDLWKHTKYDHEGECKKRHDRVFLQEFKSDQGYQKLKKERTFIEHAIAYIYNKTKEVDKILKSHQQKLEEASQFQVERPKELQDRLDHMEATRKKLLDQSEVLGEQGKLEESEHKAVEAENIKKAREELLLAHEASSNPFKTFKICEICGARQALNETEYKTKTHLEGKIHQGFLIIRNELTKLERRKLEVDREIELAQISMSFDKEHQASEETKAKEKEAEREDSRERKREKSPKQKRKRSRSRTKSKSKDKEKKHRHKKHSHHKHRD